MAVITHLQVAHHEETVGADVTILEEPSTIPRLTRVTIGVGGVVIHRCGTGDLAAEAAARRVNGLPLSSPAPSQSDSHQPPPMAAKTKRTLQLSDEHGSR